LNNYLQKNNMLAVDFDAMGEGLQPPRFHMSTWCGGTELAWRMGIDDQPMSALTYHRRIEWNGADSRW
jgi:hypothetical protein